MASGSFSDHCLMFSVAILNLICGVLGALVFCLAIWMRMEPDVREWVRELEMYQYWNGLYILIAAGAIVMIISFCGCCGALTNSIVLMTINIALTTLGFVQLLFGATILLSSSIRPSFNYALVTEQFNVILNRKDSRSDNFMIWLSYDQNGYGIVGFASEIRFGAASVFLTFILIIAGVTLVLLHGTDPSQLTPHLKITIDKLIVDSKYDAVAHFYLLDMQEKVGCCGSRNYRDYNTYNMSISDTCRDAISGNVYQQGCVQQLAIFIEKRAGWIAAIALIVAVLQLFLVCFTFCYIRSVRGNEEFGHRYKGVAQS